MIMVKYKERVELVQQLFILTILYKGDCSLCHW